MRIGKTEMCWSKVKFEAKSRTNSLFTTSVTKLMAISTYLMMISKTGIRKALNLSKGIAINRSLGNLEFLIARWSTESHIFLQHGGWILSYLKDVVVLTGLPIFRETRAIKLPEETDEITLGAEGEKKLEALNNALTYSKSKNKSTYSSWIKFFMYRAGARSRIKLEPILAYWLSWYVWNFQVVQKMDLTHMYFHSPLG